MKLYKGTVVFVKDGNVERALRKWKKKVQKKGTLEEVRARQEFITPSMKKKLAKEAAVRKTRREQAALRDPRNNQY